MATDIVTQLANSLAKTAVEEKELSYKGQVKKWDDANSGTGRQLIIMACVSENMPTRALVPCFY